MNLSDIETAGINAGWLIEIANFVNTQANSLNPDYAELVQSARDVFKDQTIMLKTMSDLQVSQFFLKGLTDAALIAAWKTMLGVYEDMVLFFTEKAITLPANNL